MYPASCSLQLKQLLFPESHEIFSVAQIQLFFLNVKKRTTVEISKKGLYFFLFFCLLAFSCFHRIAGCLEAVYVYKLNMRLL